MSGCWARLRHAGQNAVGGEDAYPDLWTKAAALLQSIVKNHALVDGNKRLAWMATAVFLELNHALRRGRRTTTSMTWS